MEAKDKIINHFQIEGRLNAIHSLGNGLINDTFSVETSSGKRYVLQKINNSIFRDVDLLQHNIEAVTNHLRIKLAGEENLERKVLRFIPADNGKSYYFDGEFYWRVSAFIEDSVTHEAVTPDSSRLAGEAFGRFEALLSDLEEPLGETIPDFHNMALRAAQLQEAVSKDAAGRMEDPECQAILNDLLTYSDEMCQAETLHAEGKLPKRICHCDTKVNNMLFDAKTDKVLCVIDLDTVMPSFVFSDYGDFLRTGANTTAEDDPDLDKVSFSMDIFKAFTQGYLSSAGSFLSPLEVEMLPFGACLFPYMQAVRFFTDYLNGDTYYKIRYPEHNLIRTRNQVKLFHCAYALKDEMSEFIASLPQA